MDWLEVSLSVDGELAEAVSEVLSRFAPNGVMTEQGIRHLDDEDAGIPAGPITVRAYLEADGQIEERRAQIEQALHFMGMIRPLPAPTYRILPNANWMEAWKKHYRPIPIGNRLMILPAWLTLEDSERVAVKIDPGMAFGTGTHPSTQLCLQFLDELLADAKTPLTAFIDVGCGSGILSIAALKLGVRSALGVDVDPDSLANARENAIANGVEERLILGVGSVRDILEGSYSLRSAPLVAANILAPVIVRLLQDGLADLVEPGGSLILAGILEGQAVDVEAACSKAGLKTLMRREHGDWIALCASR